MMAHTTLTRRSLHVRMKLAWRGLHAAALSICCSTAFAQSAQEPSGWSVRIGPAVAVAPVFQGSSRTVLRAFPFVDASYKDLFVVDPIVRGVGPNIRLGEGWVLRPAVGISIDERRAHDDPRLVGLRDIGLGADVRLAIEYESQQWSADFQVRSRVTGRSDRGVDAAASLGRTVYAGEAMFLSVGVRASWMDARYARSWFGIDATQSQVTGLRPFDAGAGLRDVNAFVQGVYTWSPRWATFASIEVGRLTDSASHSPITEARDRATAFIATTYTIR